MKLRVLVTSPRFSFKSYSSRNHLSLSIPQRPSFLPPPIVSNPQGSRPDGCSHSPYLQQANDNILVQLLNPKMERLLDYFPMRQWDAGKDSGLSSGSHLQLISSQQDPKLLNPRCLATLPYVICNLHAVGEFGL